MMPTPLVTILLDGGDCATQGPWYIIPSVGEIISLSRGEVFARVTQLIWGDEHKQVQIICKTIRRIV